VALSLRKNLFAKIIFLNLTFVSFCLNAQDYRGQDISNENFSGQDLSSAQFDSTTIFSDGVNGVNLAGTNAAISTLLSADAVNSSLRTK